jgi:hypothetical protein
MVTHTASTSNGIVQSNDTEVNNVFNSWSFYADDPWKPCRVGIKSISYKPIGYIKLRKTILEVSSTDGKRKWDVYYNNKKVYSSDDIRVPMIGTSLRFCSFCDTVAIDIEAGCTYLDLFLEVKVISVGAMHKRPSKYRLKRRRKKSCGEKSNTSNSDIGENISNLNDMVKENNKIEFLDEKLEAGEYDDFEVIFDNRLIFKFNSFLI